MISNRFIKQVELGPRQMTFGFDDPQAKHSDRVFSFIEKAVQTGGPIALESLISSPEMQNDLDVPGILQTIFWLAEEMRIHFYFTDRIISPLETKQMLMTAPDSPVQVVINRLVGKSEFERAKKAGAVFLPAFPVQIDQYAFSRCAVKQFRQWQDRLAVWAPMAEQPFFPGAREIRNGLKLLEKVLEKQDACSIITTCLRYRSKIIQLAETMEALTQFYSRSRSFWQTFVDQMQAFEPNLGEIKKDKPVFSRYTRLLEILGSDRPYAMVSEAEQLLADVQACHQRIEHEKTAALRADTLARTDKMIKKLVGLFDAFDSDPEYRNQCLHELRRLKSAIGKRTRPEEIQSLFNDARDLFVDTIEDL